MHIFKIWVFGTSKVAGKRYRMEWLTTSFGKYEAIRKVSDNDEVKEMLTGFENLDEWKAEDMGEVCTLDTREVPMAKGAEVGA